VTTYSYAELEGLWINAGGPRALAPVAAAIAEAESGGNSDAYNGHDTNGRGGTQVSAGLWQISNGTMTPVPNWSDPATNARDAVGKWRDAGQSFSPWGTFNSGAYKAYLSNKTTPAATVAGSPTSTTAATAAAGSADCLIANPLSASLPLVGTISAGPQCIFSKSNARAFIGAGLLLAGGMIGLAGLAVLAVAAGMRAAGPLGKAAEGVGGALMLVPGAEPAGAAIAGAGRTARNPAAEGRRRQRAGAREDAERERKLGGGRENPDMEVRGGTVRENAGQKAARRRREQGAARARARRSVSSGQRPASRDETGF
jgi:hypothetical protein